MIFNEQAKEKSPNKTTPKKNGMNNLMENEDASPPPIPNLRLEAQLTAEVSNRAFAALHHYFDLSFMFLEVLVCFLFTIVLWIACISSLLANYCFFISWLVLIENVVLDVEELISCPNAERF